MYRVMIVEDEIPTRNIIVKAINWEDLGLKLDYEADNGQMALEYLEDHPIDLVMTDISMPFMDGLELCRHIRRLYPSIIILILTGYNEFEYAKRAIELSVSHYLLKPITRDKLSEVLVGIREEMDKRLAHQRDLAFLRGQYEKNKEFMANKYLMNLVLGYDKARSGIKQEELGLSLLASRYMVGVMAVEDHKESGESLWGQDRPLLEFALMNLSRELLNHQDRAVVFMGPGNQICFIFKGREDHGMAEVNELIISLSDLSKQIEKFFKVDAIIGLSDPCPSLEDIKYAYQDALTALEYKVLEGNERVILKANVENKSAFTFHKMEEQLQRLEYHIKMGDMEKTRRIISYIFSLMHYESIDIEDFRTMLLTMTITIFKAYNDIRQQNKVQFDLDYEIFSKVFAMSDFEDIKTYYMTLCESMSFKIKTMRQEEQQSHVTDAIRYIEEHYQDPYLSLESLCANLYLSPGHFSRLFKKKTGETFVDYLTKLRMDQAKHLLAHTTMKMYEIAREIGYEDPNYFSYNFKKNVGQTPSRWRTKGLL